MLGDPDRQVIEKAYARWAPVYDAPAAIHRPARFVCCAGWQIRISCWRSKQSQLCEQRH
jgi:hypothetical protein